MSIARALLLRASKSAFLNHQATHRAFVKRATKRFMPGEAPEDALDAGLKLAAEGRGTVFTKLGENLTSLADAEAVRDHYLWFFDQVAARRVPGHVSVKPTQLGLDLSESACLAHCETLAQKAEATGTYFFIDMEDSSYVDRTLALYRGLRAKHEKVGICLQAYLRRTPADLEALLPIGPAIRLVKGAYAEPAAIAFPAKADTDRAFYELSVRMLEGAAQGKCLPVFGTHDVPLLRRLVDKARALGVNDGAYEIHMLYGIRENDQKALRAEGRTVRTLISYGTSWFPWYMRRLAERPANVWFVMKSMVG
ncbi:MAG: proline dehydrogenase family protein [Gemmatimonadetes bacterium]|nr:proline dehydrogenase family protein [Gemmatimonadota bacterium]